MLENYISIIEDFVQFTGILQHCKNDLNGSQRYALEGNTVITNEKINLQAGAELCQAQG